MTETAKASPGGKARKACKLLIAAFGIFILKCGQNSSQTIDALDKF